MIHPLSVRAIMQQAVWKCNSNMFMSGWIVMLEQIFCSGAGVLPLGGRSQCLTGHNAHGCSLFEDFHCAY